MTAPILADPTVTDTAAATGAAGDEGQAPTNPGTSTPPASSPAETPAPVDTRPREVAPPPGAEASPVPGQGKPVSEWSLDDFPTPIRDYVRGLRQESADHRVKAKTATEEAEQRLEQQKAEWVGGLLKSMGLIAEVPDDAPVGTPVPPEQQIEQLTAQLGQRDTDHRQTITELAIWKAAATHDADPQRLTDSRSFMQTVAGLDPTAADFGEKVAEAIEAAADRDAYFKAAPPAGQVPPPVAPPVSHVGEFAGGPSDGDEVPRTVDEFRAALTSRKKADGNY